MPFLSSVRSRPRPFELARYFLAIGLVGIAVVTAALIGIYREVTLRQLVEHESRQNVDLTRVFGNHIWREHRAFVMSARGRSRAELLADPRQARMREEIVEMMAGLKAVKLKIYDLGGLTVFSTDASQIGEDKAGNSGFRAARDGRVNTDITFRERFNATEGLIENRSLIYSYIPVRPQRDAPPEAVAEIYSDVTELMAEQNRAQWQIAGLVFALLSALYLFLYLMMRKADGIIRRQDQERTAKEQEMRHQAHHDALTGLANRSSFSERLGEALSNATRHGRTGALMFIDLDRFKIVNDSLGHSAGDLLLKTVAERIRGCLRNADLLFRMGGDEFTVIAPELAAAEDAALLARRIIATVSSPVSLHGHEVSVGATIGIAVYPGDGDSAETLVRNADAAMYTAKEAGRGVHAFYSHSMNERALQRLDLQSELQRAFREGEFALHYQPRVDVATRRVVAVEALLRWNSPARGLVQAGDFVHALDDAGIMQPVGDWVLHTACSQQRRWAAEGRPGLRVSVNVSARQFCNPSFTTTLQRVLDETGAAPAQVELELTESLLLTDPQQAQTTLAAIRALGVRTSIDGFGTGYSSLSYLRHFAIDSIKIDRSFIAEVGSNPRDRALATAIVNLAKALGIAVVAEGIETDAQMAFFAGAQCDEMQGFRLFAPRPAEQLRAVLAGLDGEPQAPPPPAAVTAADPAPTRVDAAPAVG